MISGGDTCFQFDFSLIIPSGNYCYYKNILNMRGEQNTKLGQCIYLSELFGKKKNAKKNKKLRKKKSIR